MRASVPPSWLPALSPELQKAKLRVSKSSGDLGLRTGGGLAPEAMWAGLPPPESRGAGPPFTPGKPRLLKLDWAPSPLRSAVPPVPTPSKAATPTKPTKPVARRAMGYQAWLGSAGAP